VAKLTEILSRFLHGLEIAGTKRALGGGFLDNPFIAAALGELGQ